jgi:hypothetical protein
MHLLYIYLELLPTDLSYLIMLHMTWIKLISLGKFIKKYVQISSTGVEAHQIKIERLTVES